MNQLPVTRAAESFLARAGTGAFPHVTQVEASRLIAAAPISETRLKLKILWHTGCRVSELLGIRVDDLNHERSSLKLKRLKRRKEFLQDVPVPPELMNELKLFVRAKQRRGRVFDGDRFSAFRIIHTLGRRVLGRSVAPKHFRHGRAYHLVTVKNVHPIIASRALGHASMSSILSYVHPSEQDLRVALED